MRTKQFEIIDTMVDPIPVVGPMLADLFYTWAGLADAMNLRHLADPVSTLPPGDNVIQMSSKSVDVTVRKAA